MSASLRAAASSVGSSVVASPLSAGWIGAATMTPVSRSARARACSPDASSRSSSWRSSRRDRSGSSSPRSKASCPYVFGQAGRGRRSSASPRRSLGPCASAFPPIRLTAVTPHDGSQRGVGLHGRVRSPFTSPRSATSPRTQLKTFSWTSCGKRLRSSTARNDREPCHGSPSAETHEPTGNPNCATRCPARCR